MPSAVMSSCFLFMDSKQLQNSQKLSPIKLTTQMVYVAVKVCGCVYVVVPVCVRVKGYNHLHLPVKVNKVGT